ncbi:MAG TPA: hypothetical protein VMC80_01915 [Patescibacteria group bacterium]|nr:hypothetical protein [Patescibacteria group bacterium]
MADGRIELNDFFSPELLNAIEKFKKDIDDIADKMANLITVTAKHSAAQEKTKASTQDLNNQNKILNDAEKQAIGLKDQLTVTEKEYNKLLDLEKQQLTAAEGSYKKLNAQLVESRQKYKLMSEEQRNSPMGKQTLKDIDSLDEQLKKLDKSMGQSQRNVGNYGQTFSGVFASMPQVFQGAVEGLGNMTKAAMKFIMTPLGLILAGIAIAIEAVIKYFKNSEEGENRLTKITTVLSAILQGLWDILSKVGEILVDAFLKPRATIEWLTGAVKEIGQFFKNTFGNIIGGSLEIFVGFAQKAFAEFGLAWQKLKNVFTDNTAKINKAQAQVDEYNKKIEEGQKKVKEGAENLGDAVSDAFNAMGKATKEFMDEEKRRADLAAKYADMQASIHKEERKDLIENQKLSTESSELRAKAEELKKLNAEESIALTEKAMKLDEQVLANELKLSKERLAAFKLKGQFSKQDIDYLDELAKLTADVEAKEGAFEEEKRGRLRQLNRLRMEAFSQEKDRLKTELDINKNNIDEEISENERLIANENTSYEARMRLAMRNAQAKEILAEKEYDIEKEQLDKELELKLISEQDYALQLQKLTSDKDKKIFDIDLKLYNDTKAIQERRLKDIDQQTIQEVTALKNKYLEKKLTEEQLADETLKLQASQYQKELDLKNLSNEQKTDLESKLADTRIAMQKKTNQEIIDNIQTTLDATKELYQGLNDFSQAVFNRQNTLEENRKNARLDALEKEYNQGLISQDEYEKRKEKIDKEAKIKEAKRARIQAILNKAMSIFTINMDYNVGVMNALKEGDIMKALPTILALKANQILSIIGVMMEPLPQIPQYWKGTKGSKKGFAWVGERGTELMNLPDGQRMLTPDQPTLTYLPQGTEITPANMVQGELARLAQMHSMQKETSEFPKEITVKPEKFISINFDGGGFNVYVKKGFLLTKFLNERFRV